MEELLNKLIEKGYCPRGIKEIKYINIEDYGGEMKVHSEYCCDGKYKVLLHSIRELVSKSSGLWQFVCKNEMVDIKYCDRRCYDGDRHLDKACFDDGYKYRLIECALCDEDKLEQFLLDNIKIDKEYTEEEQELLDLDYGTGYTKKFVK